MTKDTHLKAKRTPRNDGQYADKIRELRLEAGLTQPQLATILGVTKNAVTNWEAGSTRLDISMLSPLCDALGTTVDDLLSHKTDQITSEEWKFLRRLRSLSPYDRDIISDTMRVLARNRLAERKDYCKNAFIPLYTAPYANEKGIDVHQFILLNKKLTAHQSLSSLSSSLSSMSRS